MNTATASAPARAETIGDHEACLELGALAAHVSDDFQIDIQALTGYPVEIQPVPYGRGLFARRHILPGETVLSSGIHRVVGRRTETSFEVWPGGHHVELEFPASRINHSCSPNTGVRDRVGGGYDFIAGPQGIAAGEEIRTHYGLHEWRSVAVRGACQCGSAQCEGRAKGWSELSDAERQFLAPYSAARHLTQPETVRGVICHIDLAGTTQAPETVGQWRAFIRSLVREVGVTAHGDPILSDFGTGLLSGWTWVQLVDASSITGHFYRRTRQGWIDIVSCRAFDEEAVARWAATRLGACAFESSLREIA